MSGASSAASGTALRSATPSRSAHRSRRVVSEDHAPLRDTAKEPAAARIPAAINPLQNRLPSRGESSSLVSCTRPSHSAPPVGHGRLPRNPRIPILLIFLLFESTTQCLFQCSHSVPIRQQASCQELRALRSIPSGAIPQRLLTPAAAVVEAQWRHYGRAVL